MATLAVFDSKTKHYVQECMRKITTIISTYDWIIDAYVSDFYTKGFWTRLPPSLQLYFDETQPPDLAWLLSCFDGQLQKCCRHTLTLPPLSLLALRQCINSLALQRTAINTEEVSTRKLILEKLLGKSLDIDIVNDEESSPTDTTQVFPSSRTGGQILSATAGQVPNYKNGQCMDMQHIFRKHVKPKKQHEINNLGQVISLLSEAAESTAVVDVGAGLGHLARLLAFQHSLRVTTIEAAGGHAPKATEFDKDLKKNIHKAKMKRKNQASEQTVSSASEKPMSVSTVSQSGSNLPSNSSRTDSTTESGSKVSSPSTTHTNNPSGGDCGQSKTNVPIQFDDKAGFYGDDDADNDAVVPSHVICTVEPDIAASQFLSIVMNSHGSGTSGVSDSQANTSDGRFILCGLHACGDLTPTLLRVFLNCPTARGLASVACCYMKMSAANSPHSPELDNFPMSSYLQDLPFRSLSYEAREMACHFADAYHQRLKENPPHLKIHSYRAALQLLVTTVNPSFRSGQARLISKKGANWTFAQYAGENLRKLNMDIASVPSGLLQQCEDLTDQWRRVVAFYTLRLSLAPLVETLLLCDRALFLLENGIPSVLVPIFDPSISPRNFALLGLKS